MPIEMRVEGQRILVVRMHGILRRAEFDECQRAAAERIRRVGKLAALIELDGFQGWEQGSDWGDMSFLIEHDRDLEKIAVVGQEKWREDALVFAAAGLRSSPVRYFNDSSRARAWLVGTPSAEGSRPPGGTVG